MYLAYKTYSTQAKNALDKSFEDYLNLIDRTLIENHTINEFLDGVIEQYASLSAVHKRCKPRELSLYRKPDQITLHGSHVSFTFLKSKN